MTISSENIVLLGVKDRVIAFDRQTGKQLWSQVVGSGSLGGGFITLLADDERVFAHTQGELFCLDLFSGKLLWKDPLVGMGYGLASLAIPHGASAPPPLLAARLEQEKQTAHAHTPAS